MVVALKSYGNKIDGLGSEKQPPIGPAQIKAVTNGELQLPIDRADNAAMQLVNGQVIELNKDNNNAALEVDNDSLAGFESFYNSQSVSLNEGDRQLSDSLPVKLDESGVSAPLASSYSAQGAPLAYVGAAGWVGLGVVGLAAGASGGGSPSTSAPQPEALAKIETNNDATDLNTLRAPQTIVTDGLTALSIIGAAAQANNADGTNIATAAQYDALGITGIGGTGQPTLAMINSVLNDPDIGAAQTNTVAQLQAIVNAYAAILQSADGVANNDSVNPTQAQYATLGVSGVDTAQEESLLGDVLDTASRNGVATDGAAVNTVTKLQTLADAVQAVMDSAAGVSPTKAQLELLGVSGVTDANLASIQAALAAANDATELNTLTGLQSIVTSIATAAQYDALRITGISDDTGANPADGVTNDNTLTFSGTALGGATVELFIDRVSKGSTLANNLGTWTFDHTGTVLTDGVYSVTAKQTDRTLSPQSAASSAFQITVDRNDNAPVFKSGSKGTVTENAATTTVIYTATTTDDDITADNRGVTYSLKALTGEAALLDISGSGVVTVKNSANFETKASYNFTVVATNVGTDATLVTEKQINVSVLNVNEVPTVVAVLTSAAPKGASLYTINLLQGASDVDAGDTASLTAQTFSYKVAGVPTGNSGTDLPAGVGLSGNTLTVVPAHSSFDNLVHGATRVIEVTYQIKDPAGLIVNQTATITITGANDTPTVSAGTQSAQLVEDGGINNASTGTASATIALTKGDADGTANYDTTYLTSNGWSTANTGATYTKSGTYGAATLTIATGVLSYALDNAKAATQSLTAGQAVSDSFTVQVTDGTATATASASFAITGANDTPTVSAGTQSAQLVEDGGINNASTGTASATIALTKGDADGTANYDTTYLTSNGWSTANTGATYTKSGTYGAATLTIATGVLSYALDNAKAATQALAAGQAVNDSFTVQVTDGAATATASASFAITGANDTLLAPTTLSTIALTPSGGTVVANTLNSTNTAIDFAATIGAGQATGGKAEFYVNGALIGTDSTIAPADTSVNYSTSDGSPTSAELQAAIASGGTVSVTLYDAAGNPLSANGLTLTRDLAIPTVLGTVEVTPSGGTVVAKAFNGTNTATNTDDNMLGIFVGTGLKDKPEPYLDDTLIAATEEGTQRPGTDVGFYFSNLAWLDMSVDPEANTLILSLNDLLASPSQVWVLPGDTTGSMRLRGENWVNSGAIATLDNHLYVVWNNSTAQFLIDQDMVNHGRVL